MKQWVLASLAVLVASSVFGGTIYWGNDSSALLDSSGSSVGTSGWFLELWSAGTDNNMDWTPGGTGDDALVGSGTVNSGDGWFYCSSSSSGGFLGYVVAYNNSDKLSATEYAIMGWGDPEGTIASIPNPPDTHDFYMAGSVDTDWAPIPEPSTLILLGLGVVTVAARKKLLKK